MGLLESSGKLTYVNIKAGKLAVKATNGDIQTFGSISGVITNIEIKPDSYEGKEFEKICLHIEDGSDKYLLQLRFDSGYARGFLFTMKNIDFSKPLTLTPSFKERNGKKEYALFVNQNDKPIKWYWTKDDHGDLPQLNKVRIKGKDVWDNTDQSEYLKKVLLEEIVQKLGKKDGWDQLKQIAKKNEQPASINDEDPNDLPF